MMATTQELLTQAQSAYHALMTGTSAREVVDQNGERVTFTPANKANLLQYIRRLEDQLAGKTTTSPMKVFF